MSYRIFSLSCAAFFIITVIGAIFPSVSPQFSLVVNKHVNNILSLPS